VSDQALQFYCSVMMWSTDLHLVGLLDEYVGRQPAVADFVRKQLLREEEEDCIRKAIANRKKGYNHFSDLYGCWLWYSGVDFQVGDEGLAEAIDRGDFIRALFDLMLSHSVKVRMLNNYTEFHEARRSIESFFITYSSLMTAETNPVRLWWDGVYVSRSPDLPWISVPLRTHASFLPLVESWIADSGLLQTWLENFENDTPVVNNPDSSDRVFSHSMALHILGLVKVRNLS